MNRRRDIDWMRGIAVLCMIEHHTFDAFLRAELHGTTADRVFRFIGGLAAPGFLFLANLGPDRPALPVQPAGGMIFATHALGAPWAAWSVSWFLDP